MSDFNSKLNNGPCLGLFSKTTDSAFVEAAGLGGMDFIILDQEHGPAAWRHCTITCGLPGSGELLPLFGFGGAWTVMPSAVLWTAGGPMVSRCPISIPRSRLGKQLQLQDSTNGGAAGGSVPVCPGSKLRNDGERPLFLRLEYSDTGASG